ncbi:MAG: hypothetical protein ACR2OE_06105 [Thermomicrobiales bacterium]
MVCASDQKLRYDPSMKLTDDQNWMIVCAPDEVATVSLARALEAPYSTVNNARWRYRHESWSCAVVYVVCPECGKVVTNDLPANARRVYHPACRPEASTRVRRAIDDRRWAAMDAEDRRRAGEAGQTYMADAQRDSLANAVNRGAPWTEEDDRVLLDRVAVETIAALAGCLGRTYLSVQSRRYMLRTRGLLA